WVFTDGTLRTGQWVRPDKTQPARYVDALGAPILLRPGRTWVELLPVGSAVDVQRPPATTLPPPTTAAPATTAPKAGRTRPSGGTAERQADTPVRGARPRQARPRGDAPGRRDHGRRPAGAGARRGGRRRGGGDGAGAGPRRHPPRRRRGAHERPG